MARKTTGEEEPFGDGVTSGPGSGVEPVKPLGDIGQMVPDNWDDIVSAMEEQGLEVVEFEGSPWDVIPKKDLVGVPFMVAGVHFSDGKFGEMVSVRALLQPDANNVSKKVVFNDGSTGAYQQFRELVDKTGRVGGFICRKGLRASEYTYIDEAYPEGDPKRETPAATYYVA